VVVAGSEGIGNITAGAITVCTTVSAWLYMVGYIFRFSVCSLVFGVVTDGTLTARGKCGVRSGRHRCGGYE